MQEPVEVHRPASGDLHMRGRMLRSRVAGRRSPGPGRAGPKDALGPISVLVASAAVQRDLPPAPRSTRTRMRMRCCRSSSRASVTCPRAVIEEMMRHRHGAIVTLTAHRCRRQRRAVNDAATNAKTVGFTKSRPRRSAGSDPRRRGRPRARRHRPVTELPQDLLAEQGPGGVEPLGNPEKGCGLVSFPLSGWARRRTSPQTSCASTADSSESLSGLGRVRPMLPCRRPETRTSPWSRSRTVTTPSRTSAPPLARRPAPADEAGRHSRWLAFTKHLPGGRDPPGEPSADMPGAQRPAPDRTAPRRRPGAA